MPISYELTEATEKDLNDIFDYTAQEFGFDQAVEYLLGVEDKFNLLSDQPQLGKARNEIRNELRSFIHERHVIFYRGMGKRVRIIRILHGRRDLFSAKIDF